MVPEGMVSRFVPTSATGGAVTSVENVAVADDVTAERFVNNTHSGILIGSTVQGAIMSFWFA